MKTIHAFAFGVLLAIGSGVTYFGIGAELGGQPAEARAAAKKKCATTPTRWQLLSKQECVSCDFGGCNCK